MNQQQLDKLFSDIADSLINCRRENMRTLARTKALEAMVRNSIPENKRDEWHKLLNKQTKICYHDLLASYEKQNPAGAAQLDDRQPWEIDEDNPYP